MLKWQPIETAPLYKPILAWLSEGHCAVVEWQDGDEPGTGVWSIVSGDEDRDVYPTAWMELPSEPAPPAPKPGVYYDHVVFPDGEILEITPDAFAEIFVRESTKTFGDTSPLGRSTLVLEFRGLRVGADIATVVKEQTESALDTCCQFEEWLYIFLIDREGYFAWPLNRAIDAYLSERVTRWTR